MEKYMNAVNLNDLTYDELKAAYASLQSQLQALQQENERLRAQFRVSHKSRNL
jgi:prefoldin subunit 5